MASINARYRHSMDFVSKKVVNAKSLSLLTVRCKLFALEEEDGSLVPVNLGTNRPGTSLSGHRKAQWDNMNPSPPGRGWKMASTPCSSSHLFLVICV